MTDNPDQVRRNIHRLIENGGMKVGEFCDTIGVSNNAYRRFVSQSGATKGVQTDIYVAAAAYFMKREIVRRKAADRKQQEGQDQLWCKCERRC
jgi:hypothetical protein